MLIHSRHSSHSVSPFLAEPPSPIFIDWLTIRQPNDGRYREFFDGLIVKFDRDGEIVFEIAQSLNAEGSFESSARLRVTKRELVLSFNPSRWNRPDNLFGYSLNECLLIADRLLAGFDFPPLIRSGIDQACFSRIDVTSNFFAGSEGQLDAFMRHAKRQTLARAKTWPRENSVVFRNRSKSLMIYRKHVEMRAHGGDDSVAEFCAEHGVARFELRLNREALRGARCRRISEVSQSKLEVLFMKHKDEIPAVRNEFDVSCLTNGELAALRMWQSGDNVRERLSRNTFYTHRRAIRRKLGFDIGAEAPCQFKATAEPVRLSPALMPDWYSLPKVEGKS